MLRRECLEEELLVLVHREHEDAQLGLARGELARRLQAGHARHRDVEDGQVDVVGERSFDRLGSVVDLGDHAEVGLSGEQLPQPVANDGVIVGEQHPGDERSRHPTPRRQPQGDFGAVRLDGA